MIGSLLPDVSSKSWIYQSGFPVNLEIQTIFLQSGKEANLATTPNQEMRANRETRIQKAQSGNLVVMTNIQSGFWGLSGKLNAMLNHPIWKRLQSGKSRKTWLFQSGNGANRDFGSALLCQVAQLCHPSAQQHPRIGLNPLTSPSIECVTWTV